MVSSSGNLLGSGPLQLAALIPTEERKRKRMQSNRESARRSRMRKQRHLNDMMSQVTQMRRENNEILNTISVTTQHFLEVEAGNSILRAQMVELTHRLNSLNGIIEFEVGNGLIMDSWNMGMMCFNQQQPIMASTDLFY